MTRLDDAVAWTRARSAAEWLALGAGTAVFGYLAWDGPLWDARLQLVLHLLAVGAIGGVGFMALRGSQRPQTPLDAPILGLLAAFALATLSASNVGMSLRAMAAIVAFAAMLPVALMALRLRPAWVGFVASVPVLALAIPTLIALLARRLEWLIVGAPGLPPLRLASEGTVFGSVAVPPFVLIPAWALAGLIEPPWLRRAVRLGLLGVGIPLIVLSGSRSAWLAIAAGLAVGVVPAAWRRRHRLGRPLRLTARHILVGLGAIAAGNLALLLVLPRLTAVTSLLYRGALWRDTLRAWEEDPLLGIGPGFMPYARQVAAADFSFPVRQPHSHNLPLGVLGDAGLVGLLAAMVLVVSLAFVAGPWRSRTPVGRTAAVVLVGLGVGGLFEDLTFLPGFNLLVILLVAVALADAGAVRWIPARTHDVKRIVSVGLGVTVAAVLLGGMVVADAAAIAYRAGIDRAQRGDWTGSAGWLARAVAIDPWHPAGARALAVAAAAAEQPELARAAAERATQLNPGDATAWTNLAHLCASDGDVVCATDAALRAAATARYLAPELLNAAVMLDRLGETEEADEAYRLSLLSQPATSFVVDWPRSVVVGSGTLADVVDPSWQLNLLLARHATGEPISPDDFADPAVRALAHATLGERADAQRLIEQAIQERADDVRTHDINVVLRDAWGMPTDDAIAVASVVRGHPFPGPDLEVGVPRTVLDIGSFRAYPLDGFVPSALRLATLPPFPWTLGELVR